MPAFNLSLACLIAYLFGSLSSAVIVCRLMGLADPRTQGSHNPGATNVLRIGGKKAAIFTLAGDMLKGFLPVLAAKWYGFNHHDLCFIAGAAFVGHLYPLFFRFRGGKGVATLLGVTLALSFPLGIALLFTWLATAAIFHYSSLAALVMTLAAPFYTAYLMDWSCAEVILVMSLLLLFRHRQNILKLMQGTESKIGKKK